MLQFAASCAMTGGMIGIALPAAWGFWIFHDLAAQAAVLPPGTGQCGMPGIFAWCLILFGWPFGAALGASLGFIAGAMYQSFADMPPSGIRRADLD